MKPQERNDLIRSYFEHDMALLMAKGHDYAGNVDCLANLKRFGSYGIVVRLSDKFSRLETLTKQGQMAVTDESLIDTVRDIRNYCFLLQIFLEGKDADPQIPLFQEGGGQMDPGTVRPKHYLNEDEAKEFIKELDE